MTNNFFMALQWWMQSAWRLFTSFYIPGTNVTPASMILFGAAAIVGIRFIKHIFFTGGSNSEKDN